MTLSGAAHRLGGEWVISVGMRHHGNVVCTATKRFPLAIGADMVEPWNWVQEILHATVDELDCLCDLEMAHGVGCPEGN
jgi:hypothetical protein